MVMRVGATYQGLHSLRLTTVTRDERDLLTRWWLEFGHDEFNAWAQEQADVEADKTDTSPSWGEPNHEDD